MIKCIKCNAELEDGANFCDKCGEKVNAVAFCSNCGNKIEGESAFCKECGMAVNGGNRVKSAKKLYKNPIIIVITVIIVLVAGVLAVQFINSDENNDFGSAFDSSVKTPKPSGKYVCPVKDSTFLGFEVFSGEISLTFNGNNFTHKVSYTALEGFLGEEYTETGTYKVRSQNIILTYSDGSTAECAFDSDGDKITMLYLHSNKDEATQIFKKQ